MLLCTSLRRRGPSWDQARRVGSSVGGQHMRMRFVAAAVLLVSCSKKSSDWPAGALTQVTLQSTVGVLLDEFDAGQRAAIATALIAKPTAFWAARAKRQ